MATPFATYLQGRGLAETTVSSYVHTVHRWLASGLQGPEWLLHELDRSRVSGLPTASAATYRKALLAFYRHKGWDVGVLVLPRQHRYRRPHRQRALDVEEATTLSSAVAAMAEPYATALWLAAIMGLRVSEVASLRLDSIHITGGQVQVQLWGKGRDPRTDPPDVLGLPPQAAGQLALYLQGWRAAEGGPSPWLFPGRGAGHVAARSLHRHLGAAALAGGVQGRVTPHTLRHTLATRLLERGVDQRQIQAVLRHRSGATLHVYQHPGADMTREALAMLEDE